MKLLVDARTGWGAGIGRMIVNAVPVLAAARPGDTIDVLVPTEAVPSALTQFAGVPVNVVGSALRPFSLGEQIRIPALARQYDFTWFTNYWVPLAWQGPFMATVHDLLHLDRTLFPAGEAKRALAKATFAKVGRQARAIMFDSRFTERAFRQRFPVVGIARTIYLGADHLPHPSPPPVRQKRVLVVAAAKQHKNFGIAIEAWSQARLSSGWSLTIVAPAGKMLSSIDIDAFADGRPNVTVSRGISDQELADLYASSAVLLTPSLYEGFGLPLLEGMRQGLICVSSTAEALVEIATGSAVRFVNGTDLHGWVAALESATAAFEQENARLDSELRVNMAVADAYRWSRTGTAVAALLSEAIDCGQAMKRVK